MKKNRMRICGRKTRTLPAPAMTPSTTRLRNGPASMRSATRCPSPATPDLIASMGSVAHENTAWNTRSSTTARSTSPSTGCITIASMRCWKREARAALGALAARMRRTSRCRASGDEGGGSSASGGGAAATRAASSVSSLATSAACPLRLTATVSTTGSPSSSERRATSIASPLDLATSAMLSATRMGRPRRFSSSTSRRFMRRLVASTTATMRSGAASSRRFPAIASAITCSSGVAGARLYAPGRSSTTTVSPPGSRAVPDLRSTVTPA